MGGTGKPIFSYSRYEGETVQFAAGSVGVARNGLSLLCPVSPSLPLLSVLCHHTVIELHNDAFGRKRM
jgi:hypothetical protein